MINTCTGKYGNCIDVKFINECNGRCEFCIEHGGYSPKTRNIDAMALAINKMVDMENVLILGGEPMLDPTGLRRLTSEIHSSKNIYLTTNGTSIDLAELGMIARRLTAVNISIMHHNPKTNWTLTGVLQSHAWLKSAIEVYHQCNVQVRINCNLMKGGIESYAEAIQFIQFCKDLGADEIKFTELMNYPSLYVSARDVFPVLPLNKDPYREGCEQTFTAKKADMKITVKQTCGLCNCYAAKPDKLLDNPSLFKVVYPNGEVFDGWVSEEEVQRRRTIRVAPAPEASRVVHHSHCAPSGGHCVSSLDEYKDLIRSIGGGHCGYSGGCHH